MLSKRGTRNSGACVGRWPPDKVEHFGENTPLKRPGQPAELAPAYVLLASDDGGYMSGAMIPVTGGRPML